MIKIGKPKKEDAKGIQELFYRAWLATYPNKYLGITIEDVEEKFKNRLSPEAIEKRLNDIANTSPDRLFLIAKDGERVVGVCRVKKMEEFNELEAIYVLPDSHRQGIGSMMWERAREFFGDKNDIIVKVAEYNIQAVNFYKKLGFVDTGKRFSQERFKMPVSGNLIPEMEMIRKVKK
jgi:ribosomal protein S18 acetylase RimI-like enzyme